jgi:hypothetical protein
MEKISHMFKIISSTITTITIIIIIIIIMKLYVNPLLGNDFETTSSARQQILNKQVYAAVIE